MEQVSSRWQGGVSAAGVGLRLAVAMALTHGLPAWRMTIHWLNGHKITGKNRRTRTISSHNLRMYPCAKLAIPCDANHCAFRAALQSNKVYPPRLRSLTLAGIVRRRINAIR